MSFKFKLIIVLLSLGVSATALADGTKPGIASTQTATPGDDLHKEPARQGWHWYLDPKPKEDKPDEPAAPPEPETKPAEKPQPVVVIMGKTPDEKCASKDSWVVDCGFVDPGNDFEFQAKQRDILLQQMSISPDKPEAVEAAQFYMKWVVGKASQAANMWYFNMVQNPDLDPTVKNPISEVGIALASRTNQANQYEYFRIIREEGGILFFFSRDDCQFCHDQAVYTSRVAHTMGLRLINVPLDGKCLPGFVGDSCGKDVKLEQLNVLQLKTVPALFLFVPSNTWIRLATGLSTNATVLANTVNFFTAYRTAMLNGLDNSKGARPSVTFDPALNSKPTGTVPADGSQKPSEPARSKMLELMGYKTGDAGK